jgi:hypothetical protein
LRIFSTSSCTSFPEELLLHRLNIARLGGYFDALLCRKASPNLRVRLRFASRRPPNYLANSAQHLIGGAIKMTAQPPPRTCPPQRPDSFD